MDESCPLPSEVYPLDRKPSCDGPGIYFIFISKGISLGDLALESGGLIYIGKSESTIEARNHAAYSFSSSSTLRRSLGAILRSSDFPDNDVFPRNSKRRLTGKALDKSIQNFRFSEKSEKALSRWMLNNLRYGYVVIDQGPLEIEKLEEQYIKQWNPLLNLQFCCHPQKPQIENLREQCRADARKRIVDND